MYKLCELEELFNESTSKDKLADKFWSLVSKQGREITPSDVKKQVKAALKSKNDIEKTKLAETVVQMFMINLLNYRQFKSFYEKLKPQMRMKALRRRF